MTIGNPVWGDFVANSEEEMITAAPEAVVGSTCFRTDLDEPHGLIYVCIAQPVNNPSSWVPYSVTLSGGGAGAVTSVNGETGAVTVTPAKLGLGNVANLAPADYPVSTAQQAALDQKIPLSQKGIANGVAPLGADNKIAAAYLSVQGLTYLGSWNAATNSPAIPAAAAGNNGHYRIVSVAGTTNIDGISSWSIGDWIISNGTAWQKIDNSQAVASVNGKTGTVVINQTDVGLGNVNNTSDANKPVSTAQAAADALRVLKAGDTMTGPLVLPALAADDDTNKAVYAAWVNDAIAAALAGIGATSKRVDKYPFTGSSLTFIAQIGPGTIYGVYLTAPVTGSITINDNTVPGGPVLLATTAIASTDLNRWIDVGNPSAGAPVSAGIFVTLVGAQGGYVVMGD